MKTKKIKSSKKEKENDSLAKKKVVKEDKKINLPDDKQEIIKMFAQKKGDTGSPEVQVALLTYKINHLVSHLEENKKDNHSRRGLLKIIAKRRRILKYLQNLDRSRYQKLIAQLGLKK